MHQHCFVEKRNELLVSASSIVVKVTNALQTLSVTHNYAYVKHVVNTLLHFFHSGLADGTSYANHTNDADALE